MTAADRVATIKAMHLQRQSSNHQAMVKQPYGLLTEQMHIKAEMWDEAQEDNRRELEREW